MSTDNDTVPCWIYRSDRRAETYLFLASEDGTDAVPPGLLGAMQPLAFVMQLDLHPGRSLARADVLRVMEDLRARGFYLQLPPNEFEKLDPARGPTH